MNKKNNLLKLIIYSSLILLLLLLGNTNSIFAANSSIYCYQDGSKKLEYIKNGGWFYAKYDKDNKAVYCKNPDKTTPANRTLNQINFSSSEYQKRLVEYVLDRGLEYYQSTGYASGYMTGDRQKDYYITQQAMSLCLGTKDLTKFQNNVNAASASNKPIGQAAINLYKEAINNVRAVPTNEEVKITKQSKNAPSISVTPSHRDLYLSGNNFISDWYSVVVSNGNPFYVNIADGPAGSYIEYSGNSFRIICPTWGVGNTIQNISIRIKAYGNIDETNAVQYSTGNSSYQDLIIKDRRMVTEGGNESSTDVSAKIDNCNRNPLPGNWIQNKTMYLTRNYNIKQNNNNVATLKINNSYALTPEVRYDYSTYWSPARSVTKSTEESVSEINELYGEVLNKYKMNTTDKDIKNENDESVEGCSIDARWAQSCPDRYPPSKPSAGSHNENIRYTIRYIHEDGTIKSTQSGSVNSGSFTINGTPDRDSVTGFARNSIPINVPNIERLIRAEIRLDLNSGGYDIVLPIEYSYRKDIYVRGVSSSIDGCANAFADDEISVRADVVSNDIRTENLETTMEVSLNGGNYFRIGSKKAYGVSRDSIGQVYYKYKIPNKVPGTNSDVTSIKFKCTVKSNNAYPEDGSLTSNNINYSNNIAVRKLDSSKYNENLSSSRNNYSFPQNTVVSYVKVKKIDKTRTNMRKCSGCQLNQTGGSKTCPGHIEYLDDTPYYAFVIKDTNAISGITEKVEIESVLFRSRYTQDNKGTGKINNDGFIDITKLSSDEINKNIKLKAGYGFELKVDTKYTNNIPARMNAINRQNTSKHPNYTTWTKYELIGSNTIDLVVSHNKKAQMANLESNSTPVIMLNPSTEELPYSTTNQLFIKMPDGSILTVDNGLDLINESGNTENESNAIKENYRETIDNNSITRKKSFTLKEVYGKRKYYLDKDTQNSSSSNKYEATIVTPPSGIRYDCGNVPLIAGKLKFNFNVYGGYTDDIKTQLNE